MAAASHRHPAGDGVFAVALAALRCPAASNAFTNGNCQEIGAGGRRPDRHLWRHRLRCRHRPDAGSCRIIAQFDAGGSGNFTGSHQPVQAQNNFLTGAIAAANTVANNLNTATAANGYVSNQLTDAQTQQTSMATLYKGFISNIQDTNMAQAATQLSLNQTQLQAALQVTVHAQPVVAAELSAGATTTG